MEEIIISLFKEGNSLNKISNQLNLSRKFVTKTVREAGIPIPRHTYHYNDKLFENIDTEEKAYWLGFIYADGCVSTSYKWKYLEITLQGSDRNHLENFASFICGNPSLVKDKLVKLKGREYPSCRVTVSSNKIGNDLVALGVMERKSLVVRFPDFLNEELTRHFIRGYVDGNGGIYSRDPRLMIHTGSEKFISEINETISNYLDIPPRRVYKKLNTNAYSISYYSKNCVKLIDWLYKDCTIYLGRKYESAFAVLGRNT